MINHNYSDSEQKQIFSENLKKCLQMSGKTQQSVAGDLGLNVPTFNQWVSGKTIPSVSMIWRLADYFGVTLTDLVDKKDDVHLGKLLFEKKNEVPEEDRAYLDYVIEQKFQNDELIIEMNKRVAGLSDKDKERILSYIKFVEHENRMK